MRDVTVRIPAVLEAQAVGTSSARVLVKFQILYLQRCTVLSALTGTCTATRRNKSSDMTYSADKLQLLTIIEGVGRLQNRCVLVLVLESVGLRACAR